MIVEQATELPRVRWSDRAQYEIEHAAADPSIIVQYSDRVWIIKHEDEILAVAGVVAGSFCGSPPELWLLLAETENKIFLLRGFHKLMPKLLALYPLLRVKVELTFPEGIRFAQHFGFKFICVEDNFMVFECRSAL